MTDPQVQRLRQLDVCAVSDALDKLQLPGVVTGLPLRSSGPGGTSRVAGRAVTMKVGPGQPPPGPAVHLGCRAIELAGPDDLIVVEQRSGLEAGCWGGLLTLGAKVRGVAGVIADGPLRDVDEAPVRNSTALPSALSSVNTAQIDLGTYWVDPDSPAQPLRYTSADLPSGLSLTEGGVLSLNAGASARISKASSPSSDRAWARSERTSSRASPVLQAGSARPASAYSCWSPARSSEASTSCSSTWAMPGARKPTE